MSNQMLIDTSPAFDTEFLPARNVRKHTSAQAQLTAAENASTKFIMPKEWGIKDILQAQESSSTDPGVVPSPLLDREFMITLIRLVQLLKEEDDFKPTIHAFTITQRYLLRAALAIRIPFVRAAVAADEDGSVSVYWRNTGKSLQLTIPANDKDVVYIYHQEGGAYGIDKPASPSTLARWLKWFMNYE